MKTRYQVIVVNIETHWLMYVGLNGELNHNPFYAMVFDEFSEATCFAEKYRDVWTIAIPVKIT